MMVALCLGGCSGSVDEGDIRSASLGDVRAVQSGRNPGLLVDARPPSRFRDGHIPGAVNVQIVDVRLEGPPPPTLDFLDQLIVYGENEGDAFATGLTLRLLEAGFDRTLLFRGGLDEWTRSGGVVAELPSETTVQP